MKFPTEYLSEDWTDAEMSRPAFASQIALSDISGDLLVFKDGSFAGGFSLSCPVISCLPDERRQNIYNAIRSLLKLAPPEANIQIIYWQQGRPSDYDALLRSCANKQKLVIDMVEGKADQTVDSLKRGFIRSTHVDIYINLPSILDAKTIAARIKALEESVVLSKMTGKGGMFRNLALRLQAKFYSLSNPLAGSLIMSLSEYQEARENARITIERLRTALMPSGLSISFLNSNDLLLRYYRHFNPRKYEIGLSPHPYDPTHSTPITESFIHSPITRRRALSVPLIAPNDNDDSLPRGCVLLDGIYHQISTLIMPPSPMYFPHFESVGLFSGLNNLEICMNLCPASVPERKKALEDEKKTIENNAKEEEARIKLLAISNELAELGSGEEKVWRMQHVFINRASTVEALRRQQDTLLSVAQQANSADLSEEIAAAYHYYLATQPGWPRHLDLNRHNIGSTRQAAAIAPIIGGPNIRDEKRIGAFFETSDGSLANIDLEDKSKYSTPTFIIAGQPGSGKSTLCNSLLAQYARLDPRITIVDVGRSYYANVLNLGGEFIEYDIGSSKCRSNIFDVFTDNDAVTKEDIQATLLALKRMVLQPGENELPSALRQTLEDALTTCLNSKRGKPFYMRNFSDAIRDQDTPEGAEMAKRLSPFIASDTSAYGNLFDGPTTYSTNSKITCFELGRLNETAKELLPIAFQAIMQHIINESRSNRNQTRILLMDEAHIFLKDPILSAFIEIIIRTFRKMGVIVIGASQGIKDWVIPGNETAILGNIGGVFACSQTPTNVEKMTELYKLSEVESGLLHDVIMRPGSHGEFVSISNIASVSSRSAVVCYNRLTPLEYATFTSDNSDREVINAFVKSGLTLSEALLRFSREYPRGVNVTGKR